MAAVGGIAGLLLAWISFPLLLRFLPPNLPRHDTIGMSASVMVFGLAVTGLAAILMGTLPAVLAARADPQDAMRTSSRTHTSGRAAGRVRAGPVVAEVSLAFVLLVGAALLGSSYARLWAVERGFATEGLVAMRLAPDPARDISEEETDELLRTLTARLDEVPGVRASAVNNLPLSGSDPGPGCTSSSRGEAGDRRPGAVDRHTRGLLGRGRDPDHRGAPVRARRCCRRTSRGDRERDHGTQILAGRDRPWPAYANLR
jgi:putative ABC transport system permease protein